MIVVDESKGPNSNQRQFHADSSESNVPPPPTFEESVDHVVLDFSHAQSRPPGGEESPPEFTPYKADFFKSKQGWIISHDPHLNEDGEALYRFLLSHASTPPTYLLHCKGAHSETRTRVVSHTDQNGRVKERLETFTETVTDFDFSIDVGRNVPAESGPLHWSVPDSEPAHRGRMIREIELGSNEALVLGKARRKATKSEVKMYKAWEDERRERGLPPWVGTESRWHTQGDSMSLEESGGLRSSKTLRNWADEYCASKKHLKEFTYEKVIHGWNIDALKSATRTTIASTGYAANLDISFEYTANKICVRPNNGLSRILSNPWLRFILCITLIYPFIWLFQRFHPRGGGRWEVCGGAYALKRPLSPEEDRNLDSKSAPLDQRAGSSAAGRTARSVGVKEGQWLRRWEGTIKRAVATRMQSSLPILEPQAYDSHNSMALLLDGYADTD